MPSLLNYGMLVARSQVHSTKKCDIKDTRWLNFVERRIFHDFKFQNHDHVMFQSYEGLS